MLFFGSITSLKQLKVLNPPPINQNYDWKDKYGLVL